MNNKKVNPKMRKKYEKQKLSTIISVMGITCGLDVLS